MKKSLLLLGVITVLLFACQDNSEQTNQKDTTTQDTISQQEGQAEQTAPLSLNNGEKWTANAETTEGIGKMIGLINEFPDQPGLDDFHSLEVKLQSELNTILQKCTMTGEAHEQLHHYLLPMIEEIKNLNSSDIGVCRNAFNGIKVHLGEYGKYFQ